MTAEIWNERHPQWRELVCDYACVDKRFAEMEWDKLPKTARWGIQAIFVKTPFSQVYHN